MRGLKVSTSSSWKEESSQTIQASGASRADERGQRTADVAGDLDRLSGGAKDRAQELARRRLAVRPGDAEDRVRQEARTELDLAPDGDRTLARALDQQRLTRDSRALHDEIDPL